LKASDRNVVVKCLTDMLQVLQPDAVSVVAESLSFQQSVLSCKDSVQSLPPAPLNGLFSRIDVKELSKNIF